MENIRRISMGTKRPDTIPESSPRLKIRGDRYAFVYGGAEKESNELFSRCLILTLYRNESSRKNIYIPVQVLLHQLANCFLSNRLSSALIEGYSKSAILHQQTGKRLIEEPATNVNRYGV